MSRAIRAFVDEGAPVMSKEDFLSCNEYQIKNVLLKPDAINKKTFLIVSTLTATYCTVLNLSFALKEFEVFLGQNRSI